METKLPKEKFIEQLSVERLQPRTIEEYGRCLNNFFNYYDTFDQESVQSFISIYKGNLVRSFLRKYKEFLLLNITRFSLEEYKDEISDVIVSKSKGKSRDEPDVISKDQVLKMIRRIKDRHYRMMIRLTFYCGLRRFELFNLKPMMFSFEETMTVLRLRGKGDKKGIIYIKKKVGDKIEKYIKNNKLKPEDYMFKIKAHKDGGIKRWYRVLSKHSKNTLGFHVNPHLLRHSIAMDMRDRNTPLDIIKEFLRHKDISTTQVYAKPSRKQLIKSSLEN